MECFEECLNTANCVQYIYYLSNKNCYLADRFDPANGIKDPDVVSKSIISID